VGLTEVATIVVDDITIDIVLGDVVRQVPVRFWISLRAAYTTCRRVLD
jgi:hypothetical protein